MKRKESVTIGSELKEILDQKGMTAYRIAQELGVTQGYLSRLFKDRFNPSYGLVKKIAGVLGYEIRFVKSKRKEVKPRKSKPSRSRRRKGDL
jgi:transcriptional regulator with XRE-family HTH domain